MSIRVIAVTFALMCGIPLHGADPSEEERTLFFEVLEGEEPAISSFEIEGTFPNIGDFTFGLELFDNRSVIRFTGSRQTARIRLEGQAFHRIPVTHIALATRGDPARDRAVLLRIPYGESHDDCFVNGDEVYNSIMITIENGDVIDITMLEFTDCTPVRSHVPIETVGREVVVRYR